MNDIKRILHLCIGLPICALGTYLAVKANIGLPPWDAFSMGISNLLGIEFGTATIVVGGGILLLDLLLGETIGFGTIFNITAIGWIINLFNQIDLLPMAQSLWLGILMLLLGQLCICVGTYYYISSAYGCGPRDTLMVAFGKRMPKAPIGLVRGCIEAVVLFFGWMLGAKVGVGTVISVFSISFIMQGVFHLFHFEARAVVHESIFQSLRRLFAVLSQQKPEEERLE